MDDRAHDRPGATTTIAAQELLRGLQLAVDRVFTSMLSTLGVSTRLGATCRLDLKSEASRKYGSSHAPNSIVVEACVDIQGPLQGWISLNCTALAADDLARGMLRLGPGEVLSRAEVEDALGECANMVAGVLKTHMLDPRGRFEIGVPRLSTRNDGTQPPRGTLAYRLCAGTLNAELWLDHRPGLA